MKAKLSTYHQTPRKTRLVADLVRGKSVAEALTLLSFLPKRAAAPLARTIASAAANARLTAGKPVGDQDLIIKNMTVDKGMVMKRFMVRARGSSSPIRKRTSHIKVELANK